ncbi:hypothetical protein [Kitasatospora kifunensis]|uniref:Uncharacterized protein n=1 Tax=Kitasatospora kifunensis TaxID=58351 RepID=A0A7W7VW03_KITKI|nr:hypothetical protein [Kitasatospora kifunensis]MBB4924946.1 hypothetical protein [Kitasatospora kifunensis]
MEIQQSAVRAIRVVRRGDAGAWSAAVPDWAERAARAVPWVVLPSGLWRIGLVISAAGRGMGVAEGTYVLSLTAVSELLAYLTLGLVRPWGEVLPGWVPLVGGRRVPTRLAVSLATGGIVGITALGVYFALNRYVLHLHVHALIGRGHAALPHGAFGVLTFLCYLPLAAWAPLLAAVTVAYHRRRRVVSTPGAASAC